jgi:ABC-type glycerol-3-phosphate transport system substrate-binding protein
MKNLAFALLLALLTACSSTKHTSTSSNTATTITQPIAGADGSSFEKAIVIQETSKRTGVDAEYKWLANNYPGYKRGMQSLVTHEKKPYDILTITTTDGVEKKVYFDISNYFGKF